MVSDDWARGVAFEEHETTPAEVQGLLSQAARCLSDGQVDAISPPTRHATLHNAVIYIAKATLAASGYRTTEAHHFHSIESLEHTLGLGRDLVDVLHVHRKKRHASSYEYDGIVPEEEVSELLRAVADLLAHATAWLRSEFPHLLAGWLEEPS